LGVIWFLCSGICHQLADHSLHFQGRALPLCARCTGLFVAFALTMLWYWLAGRSRHAGMPRGAVLAASGLLLAGWALDGVNSLGQMLSGGPWLYAPGNGLRLVTGLVAGVALATLFWPVMQWSLWADAVDEPATRSLRDLTGPLGLAALVGALMWFLPSAPYVVWLVVVFSSAVLTFASANGVLALLVLGGEGRVYHSVQAIPYWLVGVVAFALETGAVALIRQLLLANL